MYDIIFLKSIILAGCAINTSIALFIIAYNCKLERKATELHLTNGDVGAISAAIDYELSDKAEVQVEMGGNNDLTYY